MSSTKPKRYKADMLAPTRRKLERIERLTGLKHVRIIARAIDNYLEEVERSNKKSQPQDATGAELLVA